jgi:hypothetical protein
MTHFAHSVAARPHFHHLGGPQGNALLRNAKSALRASIKQKGLGNFRCGTASVLC